MATDTQILNKWLKEQYGSDLRGRAWYRVIWSEDETEKRLGTFEDYYGSVFAGFFHGLREVKKYANPTYKERWILEKLIYGIQNAEIWGDTARDGSYEPIWVFRGPNDTYQRPTAKACSFVLRMLLGDKERRNQKMEDSAEESSLAQEINDSVEVLGGSDDSISSHLHTRTGVVVP